MLSTGQLLSYAFLITNIHTCTIQYFDWCSGASHTIYYKPFQCQVYQEFKNYYEHYNLYHFSTSYYRSIYKNQNDTTWFLPKRIFCHFCKCSTERFKCLAKQYLKVLSTSETNLLLFHPRSSNISARKQNYYNQNIVDFRTISGSDTSIVIHVFECEKNLYVIQ